MALRNRFADLWDEAAQAASSIGQQYGSKLIPKIVLDTALFPQVVIEDPLGQALKAKGEGDDDTGADWFLSKLKPRFTVYTAAGPRVIAPWGEPPETSAWPLLSSALLLGGVLAVYGGYKLIRGGK